MRALESHRVEAVLVGSVAATAYGVDVEPRDLDVAPATDAENLARLAVLLADLEARPRGPFGAWTRRPDGRSKWIARPTSEEELASWRPDSGDPASFDHLYLTRLGNFDVVPDIAGSYDALRARSAIRLVAGVRTRAAHVDDLLAKLELAGRAKDAGRIAALRAIAAAER